MFDNLTEASVQDAGDLDFLCFSDMRSGVSMACPELTEDELQALEEKADTWLMDVMGIL